MSKSLTVAYSQLEKSIESHSQWKPTIFLPNKNFYYDHNNAITKTYDTNIYHNIDIVQMLSMKPYDQYNITKGLNFPQNALFQIAHHKGVRDKANVIQTIKTAALKGGSSLCVRSSSYHTSKRLV